MITIDNIMDLKPCYDRERVTSLFAGREAISLADIARLDIPLRDRLWVLCRYNKWLVIEFACRCSERALKLIWLYGYELDPRSWAAIDMARLYALDLVSRKELNAAAYAAAYAASYAAYAAANAANAAANAAAYAADAAYAANAAAYAANAAANAAAYSAAYSAADAAYAANAAAYAANAAANAANAAANAAAYAANAANAASYSAAYAAASNRTKEEVWQSRELVAIFS